jgi:hypothetical protein
MMKPKRKKLTPLVAARRLWLSERNKSRPDWRRVRYLEGLVKALERH